MADNRGNKARVTICMVSTGHGCLDDRLFYRETLTLSKRYPDIIVMTPFETNTPSETAGITFTAIPRGDSKLSRVLLIPSVIKMILKIKPQVIHIHDFELLVALPFLKLLSGAKIVYDAYEVYPEMMLQSRSIPKPFRPIMSCVVDFIEKVLARFADCVITADEHISDRFRNIKRPVTTLFNYPILKLFLSDADEVEKLKAQYKGRLPIIYQGSITEERGLFKMIDTMAILKERHPEVILLMIGRIGETLLLRAQERIEKEGLQEQINIIGWIPHIKIVNYIHIAKIGLVPFLPTKKFHKNIPTKQFEYMACGVPVLGANLPPIVEYVKEAGCGRVYDSLSAKDFAASVISMLKDEVSWQEMSRAGKEAVQKMWNWDQMEGRLLRQYQELLSTTDHGLSLQELKQ